MSVHPRNPDISTPSPSDSQAPRTIATFLPQGATQPYRQSPHDQASRTHRTILSHDHRVAGQPQASNHSNPYTRELHLGHVSRHPSLSLDTRNLVPSSQRTPSPASATATFHADLTSFKVGLETLWSRSAHTLHTLHHALAVERELRVRAQRGRDLLATANARMWEDKVHLEGEKRELRARLDAQTAAMDARERAISNGSASEDVRVKTEDTEAEDNVTVPVREVQRMIEERLRIQADQFARESNGLYSKLAAAETRLIELEQQIGTAPVPPAGAPSPATPHSGKQSSSQSDRDFAIATRQQQRHHEQQGNHRSVSDPVVSRAPPPPYPLSTRHSAPQSMNQHHPRANFPVVHPSQHPGTAHRVSQPPPQHPSQHLQPSQLPEPFLTQYPVHQRPLPPLSPPPPPPPPPPPHAPLLTNALPPVAPPQPRRTVPQLYATGVGPQSRSLSPTSLTAPTFHPGLPAAPGGSPRAPPRPLQPPNPHSAPPSHPSRDPHPTSPTHPPSNSRPEPPQNPPSPAPRHSPPSTPLSRATKRQRTSTFSDTPSLPAQEMTADERRALGALGSVLVKKRDGDGWKCILCRQEKKSPTATFSETTPIGVVADHVRGVHLLFWEKLPEP